MKRKLLALTVNALTRDFKGRMGGARRGKQPLKDTLSVVDKEVERYKRRMRPRNKQEDWEAQRKDIEDSIENGQTFSHLAKKYPMKKEWSKYLNLLRKKEADRKKRELKVREILEDLEDRGIVSEKEIRK